MSLTHIEYGSLASSSVLNNNFSFLEDKITETATSLNTSIASILSNIATINLRLADLAEDLSDSVKNIESEIFTLKTRTTECLNNISMLPRWASRVPISLLYDYTAPSNGFLLLVPKNSASGNLTVNGVNVTLKNANSSSDYATEMMTIPVRKGDLVKTSVIFTDAYFLPAISVSLEEG